MPSAVLMNLQNCLLSSFSSLSRLQLGKCVTKVIISHTTTLCDCNELVLDATNSDGIVLEEHYLL